MKVLFPRFSAALPMLAAVASALLPASAFAATATSEIVGWTAIPCLGSSDTIVSTPLARPPEFISTGTGADVTVKVSGKITFNGTPFTAGKFKYVAGSQPNTYYAFIGSGSKEGDYFPITDNDTNSLTVNLRGDTLAAVTAGTTVKIIPFWTLNTLFPNGRGVTATTNFQRTTQILLPDTVSDGTSLGAAGIYIYSSASAAWLNSASGELANDVILNPETYFTVRNNTATNTVVTVLGSVVLNKVVIPLSTNAATQQDNFVALTKPLSISLNDSGLISSGAFTASSGFTIADQLLVYDNTKAALNKSASKIYSYANGTWRQAGVPGDAGGDLVFTPGTGVVIRKIKDPNAGTALWTVPATLLN